MTTTIAGEATNIEDIEAYVAYADCMERVVVWVAASWPLRGVNDPAFPNEGRCYYCHQYGTMDPKDPVNFPHHECPWVQAKVLVRDAGR
jgi:hypothetical protein